MRERALPLTLPKAMTELMEIVGARAAWAIVRARGGSRMYVPKRAGGDHWLPMMIGREATRDLIAVHGGEQIEVPRAAARFRDVLEAEILAENEAGASVVDLAKRYQYTERGMRKLLGRVRRHAADLR